MSLQWVIDAYALTLAGLLLAAGSLADKVGRRLVFMLGLATGIAGLGSIFQSKIESTLTPLVAGMPASSHVHELARAVASGGTGRALQAVPRADRDKVADAAHHAFVTGFNTIVLVSVAVAAVDCLAGAGAVAGVRGWQRPPEPARA